MSEQQIQWDFIPEKDLSYLKQPAEAYQIVHSDQYIYHTDGKNHYRRIFYGVEYSDFEKKCMRELQEAIVKESIALPSDWDDAQTLKYCYSGGFDLKNSVECLKMHLAWKLDPKMQKLNTQAEELLKSGVFYHLGRDIQFRPIIVLNIWKVNPKTTHLDVFLSAICNLLVKVAEVEFIRGHVESWLVILDTNEKGITDLDISTISKIVQIMAKNFTSTLEKMFIVNPSFLFNSAWALIKKFVHPETAAKIHMLKKKDFHVIQQFAAADQIEQKYGGTVPDQSLYWPPLNTFKQKQDSPSKNKQVRIQEENEFEEQEENSSYISFKSIDNNTELFFDKPKENGNKSTANSRTDNLHEAHPISQPIRYGQSDGGGGSAGTGGGCCSRCNIF